MYDIIIIGCSAAGITAAIYLARARRKFKILTQDIGGEMAKSGEILNYPGVAKTTGEDLVKKFKEHLDSYNPEIEEGLRVKEIQKDNDGIFTIKYKVCGSGEIECEPQETKEVRAKAVIVATGSGPRHLNIPGEDEFYQKGVSYCTVCDGPLFKGKTVAVVGGGNSANEAGIMLAGIASKVYVLTTNPDMTGEEALIEKLKSFENVEIIGSAETLRILGEKMVNGIEYKDKVTNEIKKLDVEGVFIHIGMIPNSDMVSKEVEKDERGQIKTNKLCETNIPGLFAAGDVGDVPFKQIVIAAGDGAIAALEAQRYLAQLK